MKRFFIAAYIALGVTHLQAQDYTVKESNSLEIDKEKDSEAFSFTAGGIHYYMTQYFDAPSYAYNMQSVNEDGSNFQSTSLSLGSGVFGNSFHIDNALALGDQAYAIVENYNSDEKERVFTARKMNAEGTIEESGTDIMTINFEKMLRIGNMISTTSPNGKYLAAVGVLPFNKKEPAKFKVSVFDETLNEVTSNEFEWDGLAIKQARYEAVVANDGTVYISRYTYRAKDGIGFMVYQLDPKSGSVEQKYVINAPEKRTIGDYMFTTNDANEMIIAASLSASVSVSAGGAPDKEIIIWRNEGKDGDLMEISAYDNGPVDFEITGIHLSEETIFVTGEEARVEKNSPANTTPSTANTTYSFSHEEEFILGFTYSGQKMFELVIDQKLLATNTKHTLYSAAHIINGELVYIFNDQFTKYRDADDIASGGTIPVAVRVDGTGLMTPAVPFMNDLKLSNGYTLMPNYSLVSGNTITMLARDGKMIRVVQISAE